MDSPEDGKGHGYPPPRRPRGPGFHRPPPPPPGGPYRRGCLPGCLLYVIALAGGISAVAALVLSLF
ncbi:MAG TPA: hypothetical protein IAC15_05980 [Candidatus Onthomonas avicola]|nr:hypothetical protein [Candidatus Onthomonas avicola]